MDEKTREIIEKVLDISIRHKALPTISQITKNLKISSLQDLMVGYRLGVAIKAISSVIDTMEKRQKWKPSDQEFQEINSMIEKRLQEILEVTAREMNK